MKQTTLDFKRTSLAPNNSTWSSDKQPLAASQSAHVIFLTQNEESPHHSELMSGEVSDVESEIKLEDKTVGPVRQDQEASLKRGKNELTIEKHAYELRSRILRPRLPSGVLVGGVLDTQDASRQVISYPWMSWYKNGNVFCIFCL
jgi:hypothetical protein